MRRSFGGAALLALACCLWLSCWVAAQQDRKGQPLTAQEFVKTVSADNLAEIDLGRLALKHATSEDVKTFARRIVDDHTKANSELNKIADTKRIILAAETDKKHRTLMDRLLTLKGADFDHEFMKQMVNDHKEAVALFEREAKDGQDPQLRDFASKTLPTLREHLKLARKIAGIDEKGEGATKKP
jgi:putative membrane protein